jgi:hypothetical protein
VLEALCLKSEGRGFETRGSTSIYYNSADSTRLKGGGGSRPLRAMGKTERKTKIFLESRVRPPHNAHNLTDISEPIV